MGDNKMPAKSKISRNAKQCVTCEYWTGLSIEADSPNFIKCDPKEKAKCNKTGFIKAVWHSCNKHQKKHNL